MTIRYCLPVIKNSKQQVLPALKTQGYDFYEVWLDYIQDSDERFIAELAEKFAGKIIFVFRRQNLEKIKLSLDKRLAVISVLSRFDVLLDLDFLTQQEELNFLRQKNYNIRLILSYHNYKKTPGLNHLLRLTDKMKKYNPDIFKIATFCKNEADSLKLLNLLLILKKQKKKFIISGMGKNSLITRIFGVLWGNELNFTPVKLKEKSAEGQLTKRRLENILKEIN